MLQSLFGLGFANNKTPSNIKKGEMYTVQSNESVDGSEANARRGPQVEVEFLEGLNDDIRRNHDQEID